MQTVWNWTQKLVRYAKSINILDGVNNSQNNHLSQIKQDYQNLIEETKNESKRKEDHIKKENEKHENKLREQIQGLRDRLHHEAEPKIQVLEKEINELLSDHDNISRELESIKTENEILDQKLFLLASESDEIIDVKDTQIKQLQDNNKRLSITIEEYEINEKAKIKALQEEHLKLQVDFEKVLSELENNEEEEKYKFDEWYQELEKVFTPFINV
jgi:chromosome segregation ATPase